jgi:MFS family permease
VKQLYLADCFLVGFVKQLTGGPFMPNPTLTATMPRLGRRSDRRALRPTVAYALVASIVGLGLFASVTPSPLYRSYSELWHFSSLTLTLIYATYAFGVLAALLVAGGVSDDVGRRPVLLGALGTLMASSVIFILARSAAWLFVARGVQGLATGVALSAASAALLDLHPRRNPGKAGPMNAVAAVAGLGLGLLVSSSIVQLGIEPRVLPYVVLLALFAVAFAGVFLMPEPVAERQRLHLSLEWPSVPRVARRPFLPASLAVLSSWSIGALFFSLGPELAGTLFDSTNVIVDSIGIVVLTAAAAVAQLLTGRVAPWIAASGGSIALAAGMVLMVVAAATGSSGAYLAGAVVGGAGFGAAFLGGLRALIASIPPQHRAAVMSAFYIVAYASLSIPAVLAGLVVGRLGLSQTFEVFGCAVAALALLVALEAWRTRPASRENAPTDERGHTPGHARPAR